MTFPVKKRVSSSRGCSTPGRCSRYRCLCLRFSATRRWCPIFAELRDEEGEEGSNLETQVT
jgi:hypothetical protein